MQGGNVITTPLKRIAKNPKQSAHNLALKTSPRVGLATAVVVNPKKRDGGILDIRAVEVKPGQNGSVVSRAVFGVER